jgi:uncharacterized caspase-like protein
VSAPPAPTAPSAGVRRALIVANDTYEDPGLRRLVAPAQDAEALAEALRDPAVGDFEVEVLRNADAQQLRLAVEDFFAERAPEDLLLLHFSCHGLKNSAGELFLAVADTKPTRLASTAVSADFVNRQMADSRAQRIALFLDCCYGGAFPRGMVVRAAGEAQVRDAFAGQERVGGGRGRVVVTASRAMEYAFEGDQLASGATATPSVFTGAVVEGLTSGEADRDGDGWVGLTELVAYVGDRVQRVTPHQNPQMWTFGSQGELLIARSRARRRVTPGALPAELVEALESPLAAARFGVVDDLRERLDDADLGQAYAAWLALGRMVDDDSRKVSEAARRWVRGAAPQVPDSLDLVDGEAAFTLGGPPLARAATLTAGEPWLTVEQDGDAVRVRASEPPSGEHEGTLVVTSPTGEATIRVRGRVHELHDHGEGAGHGVHDVHDHGEVLAAPPPPAPSGPSEPQPEPSPEPQVAAGPAVPVVPWWGVAGLVGLAAVLVALNWPPAEPGTVHAWKNEDAGWYVYRSWHDAYIIGSLVALLAAAGSRFRRELAGVSAGAALFLAATGVMYLGGGISVDQRSRWLGTVVVATALTAVAWAAVRPRLTPGGRVAVLPTALVVSGAGLVFGGTLVPSYDTTFFEISRGFSVVVPLVLVGLSWPVLGPGGDAASRRQAAAAAVTATLLSLVASIPALTSDQITAFWIGAAGHVALVAGVLLAVRADLARQP